MAFVTNSRVISGSSASIFQRNPSSSTFRFFSLSPTGWPCSIASSRRLMAASSHHCLA